MAKNGATKEEIKEFLESGKLTPNSDKKNGRILAGVGEFATEGALIAAAKKTGSNVLDGLALVPSRVAQGKGLYDKVTKNRAKPKKHNKDED